MFFLDELVKKLSDAFENKAFADILKMNLQLTQAGIDFTASIFNGWKSYERTRQAVKENRLRLEW